VFLDPQTELPACLSYIRAGAVLARDTIDQFDISVECCVKLSSFSHVILMILLLSSEHSEGLRSTQHRHSAGVDALGSKHDAISPH